jgi:hypothetical protein
MNKWKIACGAMAMAAGLAPSAHADEFTKLTLLTFSAPVEVPGITLPAGTYRFELADPTSGRRVVKVSDKDGTKSFGMFISMPNQRMTPTDKPVVMFKESPAGAPPAVQVWFYPGESYGYEFAYPHDQALKIAKATHEPVLAYTDHSDSTTSDDDRMASMKSTDVARIDENDKPVSSDEALKQSSEARTPTTTASTAGTQSSTASQAGSTSASRTASTTAGTTASSAGTAASTTASTAPRTPASTTASTPTSTTASTGSRATNSNTASASGSRRASRVDTPVATTGSADAQSAPAQTPARKHLPRTGSELPFLALLGSLSLAGAFAVRLARKTL